MAVSNHPSPMFLIGYLYPHFADRLPLSVFLLSVYGPVLPIAVLARWLYRRGAPRQRDTGSVDALSNVSANSSASADAAILSSVEVLCKIGGYLMLFSILIVFVHHLDAVPAQLRTVLVSLLEMTTGIREAAVSLPYPCSGAAACASLTFGGLCGLFQTKAVLTSGPSCGDAAPVADGSACEGAAPVAGGPTYADVSPMADGPTLSALPSLSIRQYFLWKALHGGLSAGLFLVLTG